jgi:hypothetical protein
MDTRRGAGNGWMIETNSDVFLPPGTYYVGDLCYVFDDKKWKEICGYMNNRDCIIHESGAAICYKSPDGMVFYVLSTLADGEYKDQFERIYPVDTASIGCIHERYIDKAKMDEYNEPCGYLIDFKRKFKCSVDPCGGDFMFGNEVRIIMDEEEEEEYEEDEEEEDEEEEEVDELPI